jgi:hypothetical protein
MLCQIKGHIRCSTPGLHGSLGLERKERFSSVISIGMSINALIVRASFQKPQESLLGRFPRVILSNLCLYLQHIQSSFGSSVTQHRKSGRTGKTGSKTPDIGSKKFFSTIYRTLQCEPLALQGPRLCFFIQCTDARTSEVSTNQARRPITIARD